MSAQEREKDKFQVFTAARKNCFSYIVQRPQPRSMIKKMIMTRDEKFKIQETDDRECGASVPRPYL